MKPRIAQLSTLVVLGAAIALIVGPSYSKHDQAKAFDPTKLSEIQERILSGDATVELSPATFVDRSGGSGAKGVKNYQPKGNVACPVNLGSNIKVNQNCVNVTDADLQGRGQAQNETSIAINPNDDGNLVASQNDYRRGDGNCYSEWSNNGGKSWYDSTDPMSFTRGGPFGTSRAYWQAGGDTSVAFDSKGNSYLSCQVFNRGAGVTQSPDTSSAFLVFRSSNSGASWNFPGRYVRVSPAPNGEANASFLDKQLLTVDNKAGSPFQDRVYVTWTEFADDGSAFIYESHSNDYGETFSDPVLVSQDSALCANDYGLGTSAVTGQTSHCNENQYSQPFTGSDGALYVAWANFNNKETLGGTDNRNQMLLAKSTDGGVTFSAPVKVGDYYDLPDCSTYQGGADFGRACVPEKGPTNLSIFRATNYPSGGVDPTNASQIVVAYGSYINANSKESNGCVPQGFNPTDGINLYDGVKTPGACNNDILFSVSTDGGATFTGTTADPRTMPLVTSGSKQATTDQFWQWLAFGKQGKLAVSYYDRQYGSDETTGDLDFSLSASKSLASWNSTRVTSGSMNPPTQFAGTFFGDYTGLAAGKSEAFPLWTDTRGLEPFTCPGTPAPGVPPSICTATLSDGLTANDQDIYTAKLSLP